MEPSGLQPSGKGYRDPGTDRHLYRIEPSELSGEGTHRDPGMGCQPSSDGTYRDPSTDRHLYSMEPSGLSAIRRGHPQRPQYGQTLVQNGAVSRQQRAPTESPVRAVSPQARAPTETPVRTDTCTEWSPPGCQARATETPVWTGTCTEWSPLGCQPSGEGTHRVPGTDRHLDRMEPSGL
ncbi:hypothetical protein NDU88_006671 [Pleurodeles waltl]|uniref:Uncharacterized protein n=1 Tax=Pleurodeles waltl TaxID=8319 RepID=A0AAV7LG33_PLEWA|nr:hypothetical protein NDU88_006671 [Pleurodeles waltl]